MELVEFGPEDGERVDAFVALARACNDADAPWSVPLTRVRLDLEMRYSWEGEPGRYLLAYQDADVVGGLVLHASEYDNLQLIWIELQIHPDQRRRGLGSQLLARATELALAVGRPLLLLDSWDSDAALGFAAAHDFPMVSVAVLRVLDLSGSETELARYQDLRAEAELASSDYDLVRISGRTPDALIDGLVEATAAINDAPIDDLEYEDEIFDEARIRAYEHAQLISGFRFRRIVAIERATGLIAGHTVVTVNGEQPSYGEQHDTTVLPAHRGHRLGLRLKSDMLCWLAEEEPQLRVIETQNAESNDPMISVNERLGYRIAGRQPHFQWRVG